MGDAWAPEDLGPVTDARSPGDKLGPFAYVLTPDGECTMRKMPRAPERLTWLQKKVGGYIESVPPLGVRSNAYAFYVNEEGAMIGLEPNARASRVLRRPIVGTLVILKGEWA